jgi:transposase-like protein
MAFYFVSTFAIAQTPTKQPALRLSRTKNLHPHAVFFYVRYGVSYRDLEEIMEERGVNVDHATLNRWVIHYSPAIAVKATSQKRETKSL